MIQAKLKICSICNEPSKLWVSTPKTCKNCAMRLKSSDKPKFKALTQTEDGKIAKAFKVYSTKAIKQVSTRQIKLNAAYKVLRDQFMKLHPACQAGLDGCTVKATECHHMRGRGEYLLNDKYYLALCNNCHRWINEHNEAATAMGFCQSRLSKTI